MPDTTIHLGQNGFESNKACVAVESQVAATFKDALPEWPYELLSSGTTNSHFLPDSWVARNTRIEVIFHICFTQNSSLHNNTLWPLATVLTQSLTSAEVWTQLGLRVTHRSFLFPCDTLPRNFRITIALEDARKPIAMGTASCHQSKDLTNLRPPISIKSRQLKSIDFWIIFRKPLNCESYVAASRTITKEAVTSSSCLRLVDAVLRNAICDKQTKMFGVRRPTNTQKGSLSTLAPSIFLPGYAASVASRASLIEPIAKFLNLFQSRASERYLRPGGTEPDEHKAPGEQDRTAVEQDLWMTLTDGLISFHTAQRLEPLKLVCCEPESTSDSNVITQFPVAKVMTRPGDMMILDTGDTEVGDSLSLEDFEVFDFGNPSYTNEQELQGCDRSCYNTTDDSSSKNEIFSELASELDRCELRSERIVGTGISPMRCSKRKSDLMIKHETLQGSSSSDSADQPTSNEDMMELDLPPTAEYEMHEVNSKALNTAYLDLLLDENDRDPKSAQSNEPVAIIGRFEAAEFVEKEHDALNHRRLDFWHSSALRSEELFDMLL